ncbi:phosphate/phosphite/phosphonate ABC transporter substrate-binding protein [Cumulibacter soli]|uniref:phosphate/phosphite/phosphonate ABC transporter substrate-binding protein n=1 Tax=Cumulibacter soli TaxID=2546344 RepID=UPI0010672639|nr:phosphate/phosphite/phosphonate ABC transporter substrate-binding protein [Cumulibacter soli]
MKSTGPTLLAAGVLSAVTLLSGCTSGASADDNPDVIEFGVPPGEADPEMLEKMQPTADLVSEAAGVDVNVTKTSDYLAIVEAMRSDLLDVAMFSPMPTVIAQGVADIEPLAVALGAPYSTYIICSPDAGVDDLADVQDHSMAFVDPGSTSGNYIPRLMLTQAGVDLEALESTFAGGHDVAALSVKQGSTDCAAVASMLLPDLVSSGTIAESDYEIVAESDPLPISMVVIAREGLSQDIKDQITEAFLDAPQEVLDTVGATEFVPAEDADWTIFEEAAKELGVELDEVE